VFERWLADVFSHPSWLVLLGIVGRTAVVYLLVVAAMRLLGTRPLGRMSAYDFVLVIVIANAVQNALVGGDNSLAGGLVSALTLLVLNFFLTWLLDRFPRLEKQLSGEPVVLITGGIVQWNSLHREGITRDELMAVLREHGVAAPDEVRLAVLEVDGAVSVVLGEAHVHRTHRRFRGRGVT
jgi:uncharacterized membrane protein YcaP (DUF421 family)